MSLGLKMSKSQILYTQDFDAMPIILDNISPPIVQNTQTTSTCDKEKIKEKIIIYQNIEIKTQRNECQSFIEVTYTADNEMLILYDANTIPNEQQKQHKSAEKVLYYSRPEDDSIEETQKTEIYHKNIILNEIFEEQ